MDSDKNGDVCEGFLAELKQFWSDREVWVAQAKRFAAEDMIDDVWPDEDPDRDEVTTIEAFMDAMVLRSVSAREDLEVALEFEEDGRLVGGHNILVTIHLEDGISYVEIA
ncbi:hypothetical protein JCM19237_1097 [Photobacterium aphoticum]|uniref:DUF2262 domain-containing protein n=1 Tax=Photobacterium aphoticum TaxID=754436 RepID=A0A090QMQ0_9GAMM|nr:hypothetical protein JCM19237_1097 [Photobacterium aphoticum]